MVDNVVSGYPISNPGLVSLDLAQAGGLAGRKTKGLNLLVLGLYPERRVPQRSLHM